MAGHESRPRAWRSSRIRGLAAVRPVFFSSRHAFGNRPPLPCASASGLSRGRPGRHPITPEAACLQGASTSARLVGAGHRLAFAAERFSIGFRSRAIATFILIARLRMAVLLRPIAAAISPMVIPDIANFRSRSSSAGVQAPPFIASPFSLQAGAVQSHRLRAFAVEPVLVCLTHHVSNRDHLHGVHGWVSTHVKI